MAHVEVRIPAVMRVRPESPVGVQLARTDGGRETARLELDCAGNVPHTVEIRGVDGFGRVEWSTAGSGWHPLGRRFVPVVSDLAPGRHPDCATLRFRRTGAPGESHRDPPELRVAVEVRPAR